jgi:hypothetical protein
MHLLLKGKKSSRYGAIKAIDFATTRWEGWAKQRLKQFGVGCSIHCLCCTARLHVQGCLGYACCAELCRVLLCTSGPLLLVTAWWKLVRWRSCLPF